MPAALISRQEAERLLVAAGYAAGTVPQILASRLRSDTWPEVADAIDADDARAEAVRLSIAGGLHPSKAEHAFGALRDRFVVPREADAFRPDLYSGRWQDDEIARDALRTAFETTPAVSPPRDLGPKGRVYRRADVEGHIERHRVRRARLDAGAAALASAEFKVRVAQAEGGWSFALLEGRRIVARGQTDTAQGLASGIAQAIAALAAKRRGQDAG